jgi:hypothetical protein
MGDKAFLGTGWAFPPAFDAARGSAAMASLEEDVRQSLRILFSTAPGERVMQSGYGCLLRRAVFELVDQNAITQMRDAITQAVMFHEVRVTLNRVDIDTGDMDDGVLRIGLDYTVRSTNSRHNAVFPYYLLQGSALGDGP